MIYGLGFQGAGFKAFGSCAASESSGLRGLRLPSFEGFFFFFLGGGGGVASLLDELHLHMASWCDHKLQTTSPFEHSDGESQRRRIVST